MSDPTEPLTPPWAYYRRTGLSEMRPYVPGEDMTGVSVSASDYMLLAGNPDPGGFIARNPKNHADKWYVAQAYFEENLEPVAVPVVARDEAAELKAAIKEYVEATDAYYGGGQIGSAAAWHHLMDKRDALRRLAGGVNDE